MEASALQAPASLGRAWAIRAPLLRLRSDDQLVALFRAGHDEAFRVIHDRYRQRLFAYTRQMLPRRQDAEDALQDVFVRAYAGLRASDRQLALRAWLYRVAHNRCIDELRRPAVLAPQVLELVRSPIDDPTVRADQRELLRRLIEDIRRLPDQQRSALLMRELGGMSYADVATVLEVSVPAVKSLLVRARLALAQAIEARDTACADIREGLILAHDRGVRPGATARRHMRDCAGCREFRHELRGVSRHLAALAPTVGPLGFIAKLLGAGGGGGWAAASGGGVAAGGAAGAGGTLGSMGALLTSASHVATLIAATVVTAGSAVEIRDAITAPPHHGQTLPALVASQYQRSRLGSSGTGEAASIIGRTLQVDAPKAGLTRALHSSSSGASPAANDANPISSAAQSTTRPLVPGGSGTTDSAAARNGTEAAGASTPAKGSAPRTVTCSATELAADACPPASGEPPPASTQGDPSSPQGSSSSTTSNSSSSSGTTSPPSSSAAESSG